MVVSPLQIVILTQQVFHHSSSDKQEYLPSALWSMFSTSTVSPPLHLASVLPQPFCLCHFFPSFTSFWPLPNTCYTPLPLPSKPSARPALFSYLKVSLPYLPTSPLPNHSIHIIVSHAFLDANSSYLVPFFLVLSYPPFTHYLPLLSSKPFHLNPCKSVSGHELNISRTPNWTYRNCIGSKRK